ncbi:DUF3833 family protein [Sphingomonas sp. CD22]|uniref:DUF3833 family protein n=1 Tax=Sphingomonas sp. CD22 TaxID=3100214 RepID=UPI002ADF94A1|nr:DUF3833 family protein [Sphingomonas sp. CD22]MEA1086335.1 DUF3833 family protein [Sphingomonas sp. CD22]
MAADRPIRRATIGLASVAAATLVTGCLPAGGRIAAPAATPVFDPIAFFRGATHGTGMLAVVFHHRQTTDVRGFGTVQDDGSIQLDQDVMRDGAKPQHRTWRLRATTPGHYAGTLTDAVGPVVADATGNQLHIRFAMKGGLRVDQRLALQPEGRVALNRMTVTKLGIVVARLDERIERR